MVGIDFCSVNSTCKSRVVDRMKNLVTLDSCYVDFSNFSSCRLALAHSSALCILD